MTSIIIPTDVRSAIFDMYNVDMYNGAVTPEDLFAEWCEAVGLVRVADETPVKQPGTFRIGKTERDIKSGAALRHKRNREARRQFNKAMSLGDQRDIESAQRMLKDMGLMR